MKRQKTQSSDVTQIFRLLDVNSQNVNTRCWNGYSPLVYLLLFEINVDVTVEDVAYLLAIGACASRLLAEHICPISRQFRARLDLPIMKILIRHASPSERTMSYIRLRYSSVGDSFLPFWDYAVAVYLLRAGAYFVYEDSKYSGCGPGYQAILAYYETLDDCRLCCALISKRFTMLSRDIRKLIVHYVWQQFCLENEPDEPKQHIAMYSNSTGICRYETI